jgi:tetratricopeptide (TPR) repeat protein
LTPTAARLFRLLGLHPGPDVSTSAAASLAGDPPAGTQRLLTDLARGNLVTEHVPGRYAFHDLLRVYAANLAHRHDTDDDRRAALTRLLDHYVHAAHTADRLLHPQLDPIPVPLAASAAGAAPEHLTDEKEAKAWLTAEHPVLLAAVRRAADAGFDRHTWQLAWAVDTFLHLRGHWDDLVATWRTALDAAHRLGDPVAQAYAHRRLAYPAVRLGNHADAHAHLRQALALYTEAGDPVGRAHTHRSVDYLWWRQGQPEPALDHAQRALALYRTAGHQRGQAHALNAIGWYHTLLGDHTAALTSGRRALAILEQIGDRYGQADAWDSLGYAHHHAGQHAAAVECYQQALARFRDLGNRSNEAETLTKLGESHHAAGDRTAARAAWQDALDILTELDHPDRDTVRTKLRGLDE